MKGNDVINLFSLKNKTALVVGGASGIGYSIAEGFKSAGAEVVIASTNINKLQKAAARLKCSYLKCDITKEKEVNELFNGIINYHGQSPWYPQASSSASLFSPASSTGIARGLRGSKIKKLKKIDILVNSAGGYFKGGITEHKEEDWDNVLNINLKGTFLMCRAFAGKSKKGKIINIASLGSLVGLNNTAAYCASKGGVLALTKELAVELAPNINVNAIIPGVFKTNLNKKALSDKNRLKIIIEKTPFKRLGKLNELQGAALFLASKASDFVTGIGLPVDGGFLAKGI